MDWDKVTSNLEARGFAVVLCDTAAQAADYLAGAIHGKTVGFGGSMTLDRLGLFQRLSADNQCFWHWKTPGPETVAAAAASQVYVTSVNALAETGELINIDGGGNRISAAASAKEAVYYVVGRNKLAPDFEQALWRARNVASPLNARRLNRKTPCAQGKELKCYDCQSPERICNGLSVLWRKLSGTKTCTVVLVKEDLGY